MEAEASDWTYGGKSLVSRDEGRPKLKLRLGCINDEKYRVCKKQSVRPRCWKKNLHTNQEKKHRIAAGDWTFKAEEAVLAAASDFKLQVCWWNTVIKPWNGAKPEELSKKLVMETILHLQITLSLCPNLRVFWVVFFNLKPEQSNANEHR